MDGAFGGWVSFISLQKSRFLLIAIRNISFHVQKLDPVRTRTLPFNDALCGQLPRLRFWCVGFGGAKTLCMFEILAKPFNFRLQYVRLSATPHQVSWRRNALTGYLGASCQEAIAIESCHWPACAISPSWHSVSIGSEWPFQQVRSPATSAVRRCCRQCTLPGCSRHVHQCKHESPCPMHVEPTLRLSRQFRRPVPRRACAHQPWRRNPHGRSQLFSCPPDLSRSPPVASPCSTTSLCDADGVPR